MALRCAEIKVEIREISLRDKPAELLKISPKGTVPVLVTGNGMVIDESLDIMRWALSQYDPHGWLSRVGSEEHQAWIISNDTSFKHWLDRYKYAERYPEFDRNHYRDEGLSCLVYKMENHLSKHPFLGGDQAGLSDVAIFPFIRQFAAVDSAWFEASPCISTNKWLKYWLQSELFNQVMEKLPMTSNLLEQSQSGKSDELDQSSSPSKD